ncbi:hypothetical protein EG68_05424 [Paragonimus skrjabini miyazakii]|uniref:Uncharacterized protein n=1 Tax=Paragonimus skrjabini miyazakii TaxID=59628 RepID=A0A8S9Z235_9TREM|nr:hypothetical protein EG68_05424 [Paragonimus skrjabini miyazakii]
MNSAFTLTHQNWLTERGMACVSGFASQATIIRKFMLRQVTTLHRQHVSEPLQQDQHVRSEILHQIAVFLSTHSILKTNLTSWEYHIHKKIRYQSTGLHALKCCTHYPSRRGQCYVDTTGSES